MAHTYISGDLTEELKNKYLNSKYICIDTETMGLNIHRDKLCLVQISNEDGLLTLLRINSKNTPNLKEVFENENSLKLFHFARFDLAILKNYLGISVKNVYCTKIASKIARTFTDKHSLKNLVSELLNVELDKTAQTTDWGASELTHKQLEYAASDVIYLIALREKLEIMLKRENREKLAHDAMKFLPTLIDLDINGWSENIFSH
ncbi:MAG: ribonuclease D [Candidatus Sericytochromatia bacterium]